MGATESRAQVTPCRSIQNRLLSRVTDPRSPTAGIMRTPIEVGDSPMRPLVSVQEQEEVAVEALDIEDPRSPTHGIVRTPLRPSLHDSLNLLAKQLSEVFVLEDSGIEGSPATEAPAVSSEAQAESDPASAPTSKVNETEKMAAESPVIQSAPPAEPTPPLLQQQKQRGKSPHGSGSKNVRQRSRKALMSSVPGRSPLKILQEDNSPSSAVQNRQIKKISFQSEPPSSLRSLKISHNSWEMSHNKENAQYTQSES